MAEPLPLNPGTAAARCAQAFAAQSLPGNTAEFSWSDDGLIVEDRRGGIGVVVAPSSWWLWAGEGLGFTHPPLVAAVGAVAVVLAAILEDTGERQDLLIGSAESLLESVIVDNADDWLGFEPVADGWIGVAAPRGPSRELLEEMRTRGELARRRPAAAAALLQTLGIAAMPARPASEPDRIEQQSGEHTRCLVEGAESILQGCMVLDLGRVVAGPFSAGILRLLGAEVQSVRPPGSGDRWGGGVEIDLRTSDGRTHLRMLAEGSDLLIENFRLRGWRQLEPLHGLVSPPSHIALRGFPSSSPCRDWKLYGFLTEAAFGLGPSPSVRLGAAIRAGSIPLWDRVTGLIGAAASLRLLRTRSREAEVSQVGIATAALAAQRGGS